MLDFGKEPPKFQVALKLLSAWAKLSSIQHILSKS